jgi:hypothetical protein
VAFWKAGPLFTSQTSPQPMMPHLIWFMRLPVREEEHEFARIDANVHE